MSCAIGDNCSCGFKNTGMKYGYKWDKLHQWLDDNIECDECNYHGHIEFNGLREHIRVGIGKKPYDLHKYQSWVHEVNCVYNSCKSRGDC